MLDEPLPHILFHIYRACAGFGTPVDDSKDEVKAINVIAHRHVKGRRGRTFFFIAADMKIGVIATSLGEPVDEPWIAVIGNDNRLLLRKQGVKVIVGEAVR